MLHKKVRKIKRSGVRLANAGFAKIINPFLETIQTMSLFPEE
jgi:hypothetical protein